MSKDLGLAMAAARLEGVPVPLGQLTNSIYEALGKNEDFMDKDFASAFKALAVSDDELSLASCCTDDLVITSFARARWVGRSSGKGPKSEVEEDWSLCSNFGLDNANAKRRSDRFANGALRQMLPQHLPCLLPLHLH